MNDKLFTETFSKLKASDQAKEELMDMMEETKTKGKRRAYKVARIIAVAAAVICLLTATAFAANAVTDGALFESAKTIWVNRDRFVLGIQNPDGIVDASVRNGGARLVHEDGRYILKVLCGPIDVAIDITDELAENGTYDFDAEQDGCSAKIHVYRNGGGYTMTGEFVDPLIGKNEFQGNSIAFGMIPPDDADVQEGNDW